MKPFFLFFCFALAFDCGDEQGLGPYYTLIKKINMDIK
jgi:hypothetical protein